MMESGICVFITEMFFHLQKVLDENKGKVPEWAIMIKLFNAFRKVFVF